MGPPAGKALVVMDLAMDGLVMVDSVPGDCDSAGTASVSVLWLFGVGDRTVSPAAATPTLPTAPEPAPEVAARLAIKTKRKIKSGSKHTSDSEDTA